MLDGDTLILDRILRTEAARIRRRASRRELCCLCVYFDAVYSEFFLYLNVPDQARKTAAQLKDLFPDFHQNHSVQEVEQESMWNCGDFRYQLFFNDPAWNRVWRPIMRLYETLHEKLFDEDVTLSDKLSERWAETACLVALDLERSDVLKLLRKTEDFRVICVDHDETMADSNARLEGVRGAYAPLT